MKNVYLLVSLLLLLSFSAYSQQNIGVGTTNPLQKLHVGGTANTTRIDGISTTGDYAAAAAAATDRLVYTDANGDLRAIPAGATGTVMTINGSGIIGWVAPVSAWSLTGNASTAPATNFVGTTDARNLVFRVNSGHVNGGWSGFIDQSGNGHTFFGYLAGRATIANNNANASTNNTAFGASALAANTYAGQNTAVGSGALQTQSFGTSVWVSDNTAIGYRALSANQPAAQNLSGFRNTAIGSQALMSNVTGYGNIAIGYQAMLNSTTRDNIGIGNNTLQSNGGVQNLAIGHGAMSGNVSGNWNTGVGYQALSSFNTGTYNVALGQSALYSNAKASFNVGIGTDAARNNTNGQYIVAVGYQSMYTQSYTGGGAGVAFASSNTAVGYQALYSNQPTTINNGNKNTAVGDSAMYFNTTGSYNTSTGYQALLANTVGSQNTAYGTYALSANTQANENTAFGYSALLNNTLGSSNTAVGIYAMNGINPPFDGSYNVAVGTEALRRNNRGNFNTTLGARAMYMTQLGNNNTAVGYNALYSTLGNYNVALGYQAGYTSVAGNANTSGTYNLYVGYNAGPGNNTQYDNSAAIGSFAVVTQSNSMVLGSINGVNGATANTSVGIGTSAPNSSLHVNGSFATALSAKTAAYTLTAADAIVTGDATSAAFNVTLPTAVGVTGRHYTIKKTDAGGNAVTVATTASQTIDGVTTYSLGVQWKYVTVVSDGTNWIVVANN